MDKSARWTKPVGSGGGWQERRRSPAGFKVETPGKPTRIFLPGEGCNPLTVGSPRPYGVPMSPQRARLLGLAGILGGLFWLSLNTVLSPDWGPPGSSNYLGSE